MNLSSSLPNADEFDVVIFAVPHSYYKDLRLIPWAKGCRLIYDCNGMFSKNQRKLLRDNNIRIESVGRGNGLWVKKFC